MTAGLPSVPFLLGIERETDCGETPSMPASPMI